MMQQSNIFLFIFLVLHIVFNIIHAVKRVQVDEAIATTTLEEKINGIASQSVADTIQNMIDKNNLTKYKVASSANVTVESNTKYNWRKIDTLGIVPNAREGHSMVAVEDFMVMFGGCYLDKKCFNDVHVYFPLARRWVRPIIDGVPPAEREGHTATVVGTVMYIYGGSSELGYLRDVFSLNLASNGNAHGEEMSFQWGYPEISGQIPAARDGHTAVLYGANIYYFGGYTEQGYSNQLVVLDTSNMAWVYPTVGGVKPAPREGHVVVKMGLQRMLIQGGFTNGGCLADTWMFDRVSNTWEMILAKGDVPSAKENAAAVMNNGEMLLLGGCNFGKRQCKCNLHTLKVNGSMANAMWKEEKVKQPELVTFSPRESHTMTVSAGEVYVFGGCYLSQRCFNDMLRLEKKGGNAICGNEKDQCSGHGQCRMYYSRITNTSVHSCACEPGWGGSICSNEITCKNKCSGHGKCRSNGQCACINGWAGHACNRLVKCPGLTVLPTTQRNGEGKQTPLLVYGNCSGHGVCQQNSQCRCDEGWYGLGCNVTQKCDNSCSGHGVCVEKRTTVADKLLDVPKIDNVINQSAADSNSSNYGRKDANYIGNTSRFLFIEETENKLLRGQRQLSYKKKKRINSTSLKKIKRSRKFMFNDTFPSPFIPDAFCQCFKGYRGLDCSTSSLEASNLSKVVAHKAGTIHRFSKRANPSSIILDGDSANNFNQQDGGWDEAFKSDTKKESEKKNAHVVVLQKVGENKKPVSPSVVTKNAASVSSVLGKGCPSHCSSHGVCMQDRCYCHTGFTGMSCSLKLKSGETGINLKSALIDSGMVKYAGTFFLFGVLVPFFVSRVAKSIQHGNGKINKFFRSGNSKGVNRKLINHW